MDANIKSIHSLSIAAIVLGIFIITLPISWILTIVAGAKAMQVERLKTSGLLAILLAVLTIIGGWIMAIVLCAQTGHN